MGLGATSSGVGTISLGEGALTQSDGSIAIGLATAIGPYSVAIGSGAFAKGYESTAIGQVTTASGFQSTAIGSNFTNDIPYSFMVGYGSPELTVMASSTIINGITAVSALNVSGQITLADGTVLTSTSTLGGGSGAYLPLTGGNLTGAIDLGGNDITTVGNIDAAQITFPDGTILISSATLGGDGVLRWYLPLAGGTMTGPIDLGDNDITNVGNIDVVAITGDGSGLTNVTAVDATKLPLAGGTMTGDLVLSNNNNVDGLNSSGVSMNLVGVGTDNNMYIASGNPAPE